MDSKQIRQLAEDNLGKVLQKAYLNRTPGRFRFWCRIQARLGMVRSFPQSRAQADATV